MARPFVSLYNAFMNHITNYWKIALFLSLLLIMGCQTAPEPTPEPTIAATIPPAPLPITPSPTVTAVPTEPSPATAAPPPTATAVPPTPTPAFPLYDGPPLSRNQIGIQLHLHGEDIPALVTHLRDLNVGWVKVQVSWKLFQPEQNRFDEAWFQEVDRLVTAARENDIQVLLGVAKAPEWSRPTTEMDGPPSNPQHFAEFMTVLATRYKGQVAAYELWNETNLQREWNGAPLNGAALVELIAVGSQAVKAADSEALIISSAPAPTGINDGLTAVDDRVYFQQMVNAGVAQWVDGFGIHPYGWGNPPLSTAANPDPIAATHNNHPSFFFLDTLNDYHAILQAADIDTSAKPFWLTEFGWGTFENIGEPVAGTEFMNYVSEWQQAEYLLEALAFGEQTEWIGPMLLWNLNFAPTLGTDFSESGYSILRPDYSQRPSYGALRYALEER